MSIRFACTQCGQRLRVGSHKAGKTATCPKCKAGITIPAGAAAEPPPAEPESPEIVPEPPPLGAEAPPSFDFSSNIEVVYESGSPASPPRSSRKRDDEEVDLDRIALPRYVIFVQGIMLAMVGITCFLLGMAVGGAVTERGGTAATNVPIQVSGTVAIAAAGNRTPDAGAVVILLPAAAKPDEKGNLEGVRPDDAPGKGVKFRDQLRVLGGGLAICDARGQYSLQLPGRGRYYFLAISSSSDPVKGRPTPPQEVAQMGQFFDLSVDPLQEYRYQWRQENLRGSQRVNVTFD